MPDSAISPSRREQAAAYVERAQLFLARQAVSQDAIANLETALALEPTWAVPRYLLACAHRAAGDTGRAESMVRTALEADPQFAPAAHFLGVLLCEWERYGEGLAWLSLAASIDPENAAIQRDLGVLQLFIGNIPSSRKGLMRALELDPRAEKVLPVLARMTRMDGKSPDTVRLFEVISELSDRSDGLPVAERTEVLFALARALEDQGEYDRSFEALAKANALHRSQFNYDVANDEARFAEIAQVFDAELIERLGRQGLGAQSQKPIFIVGMPRCGSTLTEQILSAHPDVHGADEIDVIRRIVGNCKGPNGVQFPDWARTMNAVDLSAIGHAMLDALPAGFHGQTRVTVKRLENFELVGLIHACLPQSTIIHCRRDPRDTCFSAFAMDFLDGQKFSFSLSELGRYWQAYDRLMNHWSQVLPPGRILDVQYEELVGDVRGWTQRLLAHCNLNWDDACLSFYNSKRIVRSASLAQVREPVFSTSIGRWQPFAKHLEPLLTLLDLN